MSTRHDLDALLDRALVKEPVPHGAPAREVEERIRRAIAGEQGKIAAVRPLAAPHVRAAIAGTVGLGAALAVAWVAGMHVRQPFPWVGAAAALAVAIVGLWFAMRLVVPGGAPSRPWVVAFLLVPLFFAGIVLALVGSDGALGPMKCLKLGLLVAVIPWLGTMAMLWRGYSLFPATAGGVAGTAAGLYGLAMLHLSCPMLTGPHLLFFHGGVLVIAAAVGAAIARLALNHRPPS